ncbi:MAG: hypothetical protein WA945_05750, partial [Arcobacteraceae bacterium]
MNQRKAITYSLLAYTRSNTELINGPLDIFVPLIKRALSIMHKNGINSGKNISEIYEHSKKIYDMVFPLPVLKKILNIISTEINNTKEGAFILNKDDSFIISNYTFVEYDEVTRKREVQIKELEELFQKFCTASDYNIKKDESIFHFIEEHKITLAKYLSNSEVSEPHDYTKVVQFINYFKNITPVYDLIKSLYLGSILSEYIEYTPTTIAISTELLFDTNFIISLIDLNTSDSTITCNTLLDIAREHSYTLSILPETIDEIKNLLITKAENFQKSFMVKDIYTEDIYNACERRNITPVDLERIIDNIEQTIQDFGINIVDNIEEIREKALSSELFNYYSQKRRSKISAQHDTIATYYIRHKRNYKNVTKFVDVTCWFVNNAISHENNKANEKFYQPEIIRADDLLSIMWLSNPSVSKIISSDDISDIGLSSLLSLTFAESLPKTSIIRELEDNIRKYKDDIITDRDIIRLSTRIADSQLIDIEELNKLANEDVDAFVSKLQEESKKQAKIETERIESLSKIANTFTSKIEGIEKLEKKHEKEMRISASTKERNTQLTNAMKVKLKQEKLKNDKLIDGLAEKEIKKWKGDSIKYLIIFNIIYIIGTFILYALFTNLATSSVITLFGGLYT